MPTHSQPRPSTADEYATDWWSDLTGGGGYYGSGGYDPYGAGGSRPANVSCSDDKDAGRDDDDDELSQLSVTACSPFVLGMSLLDLCGDR